VTAAVLAAPQVEPAPLPAAWSALQRLAAILALVALAPLFAALYVAVRATSRGPFLFRQVRPGQGERPFTIFKIRTLRQDSEGATALGVTRRDARITAIGRWLRELKLDELPQLWNVARGEMAIVGPRPIPAALDRELRGAIPGFARRYLVRPGLTNLSQVTIADNRVGSDLLADWRLRFEGELHYLEHRSVAYDLAMIGLTALFVLRRLARVAARPRRRAAAADAPACAAEAPATELLGVPVSNVDYEQVLAHMEGWIARGQPRYVGVTPVHSLVDAVWSPSHRQALRGAALNTPDGVPVVWAQRLLGVRGASRVYGPDLMLHGLARAEARGWRVALYGGSAARLATLEQVLRGRFPRLRLVAAISPPYRPLTAQEDEALTAQLRDARPDLTWVGLGCPKQERWMAEHCGRVPGVLVGVGAAFDFHCGAVPQAPARWQRLGLEWLFRLLQEPRRLFWRYATANPTYVLLIGLQLLRRALTGERYQLGGGPR